MNLQSEITELRSLMAEPYRSTDSDAFFIDSECARWIYGGETAAFNALCDGALATMAVDSASITLAGAEGLVSGTNSAVNWNRVLGVFVIKGGLSVRAKLLPARAFYNVRNSSTLSSPKQEPAWATLEGQTVRVFSDPAEAITACTVKYLPRPTQRAKRYKGVTTSAGTAFTIVDSNLPVVYGTGNWFLGSRAQIRNGTAGFVESLVTLYSGSTLTVEDMGAAPGVGATFDVGEVSSLPAEYYPVWMAWSAFLAANKKRPEKAGVFFQSFMALVERINSRFARGNPGRAEIHEELED